MRLLTINHIDGCVYVQYIQHTDRFFCDFALLLAQQMINIRWILFFIIIIINEQWNKKMDKAKKSLKISYVQFHRCYETF